MKKFDLVYDKDAYIHGIITEVNNGNYTVLWDNDVKGTVKKEYDNIVIKGHFDNMEDYYNSREKRFDILEKQFGRFKRVHHEKI